MMPHPNRVKSGLPTGTLLVVVASALKRAFIGELVHIRCFIVFPVYTDACAVTYCSTICDSLFAFSVVCPRAHTEYQGC